MRPNQNLSRGDDDDLIQFVIDSIRTPNLTSDCLFFLLPPQKKIPPSHPLNTFTTDRHCHHHQHLASIGEQVDYSLKLPTLSSIIYPGLSPSPAKCCIQLQQPGSK